MEQNIRVENFMKSYEKNITPYYAKEIVPYAAERKLFKLEDVGRLGTSATHLGMGTISAKTSAGKYMVEFLNKATIHGLNHLVAPNRHFMERILAILFIGVGLTCLVVSSLYSWYQYQNNPTSMVLDFDYKNFNVTKPALTICLYDKISTDKIPIVFEKYGVKDTQEARDFFRFISQPVYPNFIHTPIYTDTAPYKWLEILRDLYPEFDLNNCDSSEDACMQTYNISTFVVATEKGICTMLYSAYGIYSSNEYWLADNWTVLPQETLPVYTYAHRDDRIALTNIPGEYEESLALHHPNEVSRYDDFWYQIKETGIADIRIDVQRVESSDDLRKLSQHQRPCNYPEDGKLTTWPVYTYNMCMLECRYDYMKSKCGCYPYFARPMPGVPVCNATQLRCIGKSSESVIAGNRDGINSCTCPDGCDTARYKIISSTIRDFHSPPSTDFIVRHLVNIDLQFPFMKLRHEVFFGFNEFLVSVGGAAGLFVGASIISFIEILYYVTLRLLWYKNDLHRKGKK